MMFSIIILLFINKKYNRGILKSETYIVVLKGNQQNGQMKAPEIKMDNKDFGIGAQILHDLKISKLKLITNTQQTKRVGIIGYGLEIVDYISY